MNQNVVVSVRVLGYRKFDISFRGLGFHSDVCDISQKFYIYQNYEISVRDL
jgi:hypothetical protein